MTTRRTGHSVTVLQNDTVLLSGVQQANGFIPVYLLAASAHGSPPQAQITILYDAFGRNSRMQKDWGYAAFVEYGGKRFLFNTGNNPRILAENAKAKGVDLTKLDFVVMSHRHGDHMGGLRYLLSVGPTGFSAPALQERIK